MHPQVSIADRYKYWVDTKCTAINLECLGAFTEPLLLLPLS